MARGWESKSVEQQQEEMKDRNKSPGPRVSSAQQKLNRHREGLLLTRKRLVDRLRATTQTRHRQMLEDDLAEVDKQLLSCEEVNEP